MFQHNFTLYLDTWVMIKILEVSFNDKFRWIFWGGVEKGTFSLECTKYNIVIFHFTFIRKIGQSALKPFIRLHLAHRLFKGQNYILVLPKNNGQKLSIKFLSYMITIQYSLWPKLFFNLTRTSLRFWLLKCLNITRFKG